MESSTVSIGADASAILPMLARLTDLVERRGLLPEFREILVDLVQAIPSALETTQVDDQRGSARAGDVLIVFQFRQWFLDRATALFAFDADFDAVAQAHGSSFHGQ